MRNGEEQWMRPCQLPTFSRESSVKKITQQEKIPFLFTINNHITNAIMSYLRRNFPTKPRDQHPTQHPTKHPNRLGSRDRKL